MSLRFKKGRANPKTQEFLTDRKVQLLLGWFVQGDIETLQPALDQENGITYPTLDPIVNDPSGAEPFLKSLADNKILEKRACGYVLSCKGCGARATISPKINPGEWFRADNLGGRLSTKANDQIDELLLIDLRPTAPPYEQRAPIVLS